MEPIDLSVVDRLAAGGALERSPFAVGVASAGYKVEGGYNGDGEPQTNWTFLERASAVERSGAACRFFEYAEADLDAMQRMGLDMFRMSVEWARVQPDDAVVEHPDSPPPFDDEALRRYARVIAAAQARGIEPCVTLHHFVHPLWAGLDLWLHRERVRHLFARYVEHGVRTLGRLLRDELGARPVRYFVTLDEINLLPIALYLDGRFPHGVAPSAARMMTAYCNVYYAHVLAYDVVHRVYAGEGFGEVAVSASANSSTIYHLDKLFLDLLGARELGVARADLGPWLDEQARVWRMRMHRLRPPRVTFATTRLLVEKLLAAQAARMLTVERLSALVDDVYASPLTRKLDFVALDFYDPFPRSQLGVPAPGRRIVDGRPSVLADVSRQAVNPSALRAFMHAYLGGGPPKPILVAENGMCHLRVSGRTAPRRDRVTRDAFIKAYVIELLGAVADGLDVLGYLHRSFCDAYEWGSFAHRFGLFSVDFEAGARRLPVDAFGTNAAGAYAALALALRSREPSEVRRALTARRYPIIAVD